MFHVPARLVYLTVLRGLNEEALMKWQSTGFKYCLEEMYSCLHSLLRVTKNNVYVYIYMVCNPDVF